MIKNLNSLLNNDYLFYYQIETISIIYALIKKVYKRVNK